MTHIQMQQRATERAKKERLHSFRLCDGRFLVKSRKMKPGTFHLVTTTEDGVAVHCDCPGWQYRKCCTHAAAVIRRTQREMGGVA